MARRYMGPNNQEVDLGAASDKWKEAYIETLHGDVDGNAKTATKATQDANGNNIANYYAPKDNLKSKGSATVPVYMDADGKPQPITSYAGKADSSKVADEATTGMGMSIVDGVLCYTWEE